MIYYFIRSAVTETKVIATAVMAKKNIFEFSNVNIS